MNPLLVVGQLGVLALVGAVNPMVKGEYRVEHPKLNDLSELQSKLSANSYFESFQYRDQDEFRQNWVSSDLEMEHVDDTLSRAFPGEWKLEAPYLVPGFIDDLALVLGSSQTRAAIAHKFDTPVTVKSGEKFVVQYEVKLQKMLECGGAYMKLLKSSVSDLSQYDYSADDYALVFGPDSCSMYTNEVHLVLKRENPISGKWEDKYLADAPESGLDRPVTRLYTLILDSADETFEIRVDGEVVKAGSLLDQGTFQPPLSPPIEIEDPSASEPLDWDSRSMIPDPKASKPVDWDEDAPKWIPAPNSKKPESWDESIPEYIEDSSVSQPGWWDEEKDGRWIAPLVVNPSCNTEHGCGEWKPKMVENKKYRGPWKSPMVENPDYKGEWKAPLIKNPDYFEDTTPAEVTPISAISFDIWSTASDISFDNVYVGKSVEEAELIGNATFIPKSKLEQQELKGVIEDAGSEEVANAEDTSVKPEVQAPRNDPIGDILIRLDEKLQSMEWLQRFFTWFIGIDDFYKGVVISSIMVVIVSITCMGILKLMITVQGINLNAPSDNSKKEVEEKKLEQSSQKAVITESDTDTAASSGFSESSSKLLSKRIIQLQGDSDYDEELEISIIEEDPSDSEPEDN
ncbi:unnamed protein product [Kluyveromyces dobzhanskii CBS 2104]|uniref:WGS project CCBQ000000000 data, contig 00272 n=1 Tax=Kluyveromyces dobzhanskii CBS 2104 TaxID=1427455 RepID=A0A0A8LAI9_9SACH|nr:unnamed protein product [Kluyveromyces dobzhanskii CBS 2104]